MSQAAGNSPQSGQPKENYIMEIGGADDLETAELFVKNNPGTRVILDYKKPIVSRGAGEAIDEESENVHTRLLGGATTYEDSNSYGVIQSGGCFEDFRDWAMSEVNRVVDEPVYADNKDVYLDQGSGRLDPKVLGFGARMDKIDSPNIYGFSWREGEIEEETRNLIENDYTAALPEEVDQHTHTVGKEGRSLFEVLEAGSESVEKLLDAEKEREIHDNSTQRSPQSCTVAYRPEQDFNIDRRKVDTAAYPWHTS